MAAAHRPVNSCHATQEEGGSSLCESVSVSVLVVGCEACRLGCVLVVKVWGADEECVLVGLVAVLEREC